MTSDPWLTNVPAHPGGHARAAPPGPPGPDWQHTEALCALLRRPKPTPGGDLWDSISILVMGWPACHRSPAAARGGAAWRLILDLPMCRSWHWRPWPDVSARRAG